MSYAQNRRNFPEEVTSYDLLKAIAIILMIVDHIGWHFFPEEPVFRLIGRMCVPMWFFLIGYANSRDLTSPFLWVGGLALIAVNPIAGIALMPLNILFSIMFVRLVLDRFIGRMLKSRFDTFMGGLVLVLLFIPFLYLFEYGTVAVALAMVGYLARHKDQLQWGRARVAPWLFLITIFFSVTQMMTGFGFSDMHMILLLVGSGVVITYLYTSFKPYTFQRQNMIVSFLGRYSLEIYVIHLIVFKLLMVGLGIVPSLEWFTLYLFPGGAS